MKRSCLIPFLLLSLLNLAHSQPLPVVAPEAVGLDPFWVRRAVEEVNVALLKGAGPGAVMTVVKDGKIALREAVGQKRTQAVEFSPDRKEYKFIPVPEPMTLDTVFDLASLTKMVATTTSAMILVEKRKLNLDRPVSKYIPSFGAKGKDKITVRQLITHTSGLPAWSPLFESCVSWDEVFEILDEEVEPASEPGTKRVYSDLGFMMLGRLVEKLSGKRLDRFAYKEIFEPLGMLDTGFLPHRVLRARVAPTEFDPFRRVFLQGIVDDENARSIGGISGHAGLFSTADDLAVFAQMILNQGEWKGKRILKEKTVKEMLEPQIKPEPIAQGSLFLHSRRQLLGWWGMDSEMTIDHNGGLPSRKAFGHSGYTGTLMYIDPEHDTALIFLSNAIHPKRENANKRELYKTFCANIGKALVGEKMVNVAED